jgi:hypothetical protein
LGNTAQFPVRLQIENKEFLYSQISVISRGVLPAPAGFVPYVLLTYKSVLDTVLLNRI